MAVLYAKVGGAWVPIGGSAGAEEVFVGPDDPGGGYDLWYDTDAQSIVATPWVALGLNANWANVGAPQQVLQYRKIGDNVQVRGEIVFTAGGANPFATLPVGFRPPANINFPVANRSSTALLYAGVAADGSMHVFGLSTTTTIALGAIIFSTVA